MSNKRFKKQKPSVKAVKSIQAIDEKINLKAQKWGEVIGKSLATYFMMSAELDKMKVPNYDKDELRMMSSYIGYDGIVYDIKDDMETWFRKHYRGKVYDVDKCFESLNQIIIEMQKDCKCPIVIDLYKPEECYSILIKKIEKKYPREKLLKDWYINCNERLYTHYSDEERAEAGNKFEKSLWDKIIFAINQIPNSEIDTAVENLLTKHDIFDDKGDIKEDASLKYVRKNLPDGDELEIGKSYRMALKRKIALELYHSEVLFSEEVKTIIAIFKEWIVKNHNLFSIKDDKGALLTSEKDNIYPLFRKRVIERIEEVFRI